ncbi:MAG: hypothetical protein ACREAF_00515 [Nitrosopumilaceae archaeon]
MAKKRSVVVTGIILAAITAASFSVWFIPQSNNSSFVVSDFKGHLESVKARHGIIAEENGKDLQNMLSGTMAPDDFITKAEASTSQINSLIIEIVESRALQEWRESYLNYGESLKSYNSYLREAIVLASKIKGGSSDNLQENLETLDILKKESESFALRSDETRP